MRFSGNPTSPAFSFLAAANNYAPSIVHSSLFDDDTINPWIAGQLFKAAATHGHLTPTSSSQSIKRALYGLKNETLDGLAPPLNYTPGKPAFSACYFGTTIKNGQFVGINGGKPSCLSTAQTSALANALKGLA